MIKQKITIYLFISFFFILNTVALSKDKIVYLNIDFILKESNLGKIIFNELKEINDKNLEKISLAENEIKKENDEINRIKNIITDEELDIRLSSLNKKIENYNNLKKDLSNKIIKIEKNKIKNFFEKVNPFIQAYMDENEVDIIIDQKNIFIARSKSDITSDILDIINSNFK